ncbi:hypothetical protein [Aminiphilus sp.]|uniref:hypothetical protein n=1 Tax=Aminiphilus sp. TaxID=1872488 RepID=UPI00260F40EB|nr:hypothetical protein [Aminiphilus sp.]
MDLKKTTQIPLPNQRRIWGKKPKEADPHHLLEHRQSLTGREEKGESKGEEPELLLPDRKTAVSFHTDSHSGG